MSTPGEKSLEQRGMTMRVAQPGDLARILEIVEAARAFLAAEGIDQWQKGTPAPSDFERDIELGWGRVVVLDDQNGVAEVAQLPKRGQKLVIVALVQAD